MRRYPSTRYPLWRYDEDVGLMRRICGLALAFAVVVVGCVEWPSRAVATPPSPSLVVQPTSGPVGSVVTVRSAALCGQVVFGRAGAIGTGSALTSSSVVHYVIPDVVGIPGVPVTRGHYAFGVTCSSAGSPPSFTNVEVPFTVTAGATPNRFVAMAPTSDGGGYWLAQRGGGVYSFGDAGFYGSLPGLDVAPVVPIVGIAAPLDGRGYWLVGADGGVFSFGDAVFHGSLPSLGVTPDDPIVGMAVTSDGGGYWLIGADGGIFAFGDAPYCNVQLATAGAARVAGNLYGPVLYVGMAAYPGSVGYAVVDGSGAGIVTPLPGYGCAPGALDPLGTGEFNLFGGLVGMISGMGISPKGGHLWLVGSDGGVFTPPVWNLPVTNSPVAQAPLFGSLPALGITPGAPIVGITPTPDGGGYWLLGADGGVFGFGDAIFFGSAAS